MYDTDLNASATKARDLSAQDLLRYRVPLALTDNILLYVADNIRISHTMGT